jgi:hypothetical protein
MSLFYNTPLKKIKHDDLKSRWTLELRAEILDQRLLNFHYSEIRKITIEQLRIVRNPDRPK